MIDSLPRFLTISPNLSFVQFTNENLYMVSWEVNAPLKEMAQPMFWFPNLYEDFKISLSTYMDSKSQIYDNCDMASSIIFSYPQSLHTNPFGRLFTYLPDWTNSPPFSWHTNKHLLKSTFSKKEAHNQEIKILVTAKGI